MKFAQCLSRWHGITDGSTVGGDVSTVTATTAAITANHAADCYGVSDDGASGA